MKRPLRLMKWLGFAILLALAVVVLAALLVVQTEPGTRWAVSQAVRRANAVEGLSVAYESLSGTLVAGLNVDGLEVVVPAEGGSHRISLDALRFQWNPFLLADSLLRVTRVELQGLAVALAPSESEEPSDFRAVLDTVFSLPIEFAVDEVRLNGFVLAMEDFELRADGISAMGLALDNSELRAGELHFAGDPVEATATGVALRAGSLDLAGALQWRVALPDLALQGEAELGGSLARLDLRHRLFSPLALASAGTVEPGLLEQTPPAFDLSHSLEGLAGEAIPGLDILRDASGNLSTAGSVDRVAISGNLRAVLEGFDPFTLELDAVYAEQTLDLARLDLSGNLLDFAATGRLGFSPALSLNADWELERVQPSAYLPEQVSLEELSGSGSLSLDMAQGLDATLDLAALSGRLNGHPLEASGRAALDAGRLEDLELAVRAQDNTLRLRGGLQPDLDLAWEIDAPALRVLLPEMAGRLSGSGTLLGSLEAPELAGELRGEALAYRTPAGEYALSTFALGMDYRETGDDNRVDFDLNGLRLPLGESPVLVREASLRLRGQPGDHGIGLEAEVQSQRILLSARGGLDAGTWRGRLEQARLISDYGDWELEQGVDLLVSARQASVGAHCWRFLQIGVCGEAGWDAEAGYEAALRVSGLPLALLNSAETVSRLEDPALSRRLEDKPIGLAGLQERFSLSPPANVFVDGVVDLEAAVTSEGDGLPRIEAHVAPDGLRLGLLVEEDSASQTLRPEVQTFAFEDVDLDLVHRGGRWEGATSFAVYRQMESDGGLLGNLDGSLALNPGGGLDGVVNIDFADIVWLETVIPMISGTRGELDARAEIGGDLERPLLQADLALRGGGFMLSEYGLDVHDVELMVRSGADNAITLNGSAVSGAGSLALEGRVTTPLRDTRRVDLSIRGQDFQVMGLADTQAVISPTLDLSYGGDTLDVRGEVAVPRFLLDLESSEVVAQRGGGGVEVSRDVVVVDAPPEQSELLESNGSEAVRRIAVTGDVTVELGEDVRFSGYGLDIQLGGELTVEKEATRPVLAYGEISVLEGTYESYGQDLSAEGKLIFLGNPLNPALDMRAYREIQNATVGVQMSGTLRNIQGQLYSTPVLPESEILAILVTGKSFQNVGPQDSDSLLTAIANFGIERGQGITDTVRGKLGLDTLEVSGGSSLDESSLGLGKYITPDLFLRYDVGLFDRQSSLSLMYALTERLRLEVQTGVSQSVDLTYTVEK